MRDYEIAQWLDFVRGAIDPPEREAMQRHLDEGCRECAGTVEFLRRVMEASASTPVPEDLADAARRVFGGAQRVAGPPAWLDLPVLAARLIYNSLESPLPAGVRAAIPTTVHLIYEAGRYTVDLHVERPEDSADLFLVGQIADRDAPDQPPPPTPVYLATPSKTVATAVSNEFGEFSLACRPQANLRLSIPVEPEGRRLEVPLADSLTEQR